MVLKKITGALPEGIVLLFILSLLLWVSVFLVPKPGILVSSTVPDMPLYHILKTTGLGNNMAGNILSLVFMLLIMILVVMMSNKINLLGERNYCPAFFYLFFVSSFPQVQMFGPVLPATVCLLFAIEKIIGTYRVTGYAREFFDAGLLIGTGFLFYPGIVWFGLLLIMGNLIIRAFNLREIFISLIGLLTPFIMVLSIYFLTDSDWKGFLDIAATNLFGMNEVQWMPSTVFLVFEIILSAVLVVSVSDIVINMGTKVTKTRKTYFLLIWTLFITVILFLSGAGYEVVWIAGIPSCYFFSHFLISLKKKIFSEIVIWLSFFFVVAIQLMWILSYH